MASCLALYLQEEPDGIMTVKFRDPISAKACIVVSILTNIVSYSDDSNRKWMVGGFLGEKSKLPSIVASNDSARVAMLPKMNKLERKRD